MSSKKVGEAAIPQTSVKSLVVKSIEAVREEEPVRGEIKDL